MTIYGNLAIMHMAQNGSYCNATVSLTQCMENKFNY